MNSLPLLQTTMSNLQQHHPLAHLALFRHQTIRGKPLSFRDRPFQIEQYVDFADPKFPGADICKAVQTGQSEMFSMLGIYQAGKLGRIFAYVLPVDRVSKRFVSTRINPLLMGVPEYRRMLPGVDVASMLGGDSGSLSKKRIGTGLMMFLGCKTDGDFVELTADTFVADEYDSCQAVGPHNLVRIKDRMKEAVDPQFFRLGNPELPGGIEDLFDAGDARLYHWRCDRCGERQPIDWTGSVVDQDDSGSWFIRDPEARMNRDAPIRPVCRRCGRPFGRDASGAAWVPKQPTRDRRSYRMTRFDVLSEPLRDLWVEWVDAQSSRMKLKEWYRRNAGSLHTDASNEVTEQQLRSASALPLMDYSGGPGYADKQITAGIDVGSLFHIKISESVRSEAGTAERRMVWTGTCREKEQVLDILERYHVRVCTIDQFPETRAVEEIQTAAARFGCTVWLCSFHRHAKTTAERFGMTVDWRAGLVKVDRTQAMDEATDLIHVGAAVGEIMRRGETPGASVDGLALFSADAVDVLGWVAQMIAPKRIMVKGAPVWDEGSKEDHFRFSDLYELIAWEISNQGAVIIDLG